MAVKYYIILKALPTRLKCLNNLELNIVLQCRQSYIEKIIAPIAWAKARHWPQFTARGQVAGWLDIAITASLLTLLLSPNMILGKTKTMEKMAFSFQVHCLYS